MSYSRIGVVTGANKVLQLITPPNASNVPRASVSQLSAKLLFNTPSHPLTMVPCSSTSQLVTRVRVRPR